MATGNSTLLVSTDPQGSSFRWLERVEKNHGAAPCDYTQVDSPGHLKGLQDLPYTHIFVDTAGSLVDEETLLEVLKQCHDVIIPLEPEPLSFKPTVDTITTLEAAEITLARQLSFRVVVNNWDPRDGEADLKQTAQFIRKMGWPACETVIRHYKVHARASAEGVVATQYRRNRVALEAQQDFYRLALELGYGTTNNGPGRVHLLLNQKGGVGKSTLAVNLAAITGTPTGLLTLVQDAGDEVGAGS